MYIRQGNLRIVNVKDGTFLKEVMTYFDCRCLPRVICILLEGNPEDSQLLLLQIIVEGLKHPQEKTFLSVIVYLENRIPIVGNLNKSFILGQVNQCQNILFEAAASESHATVQKLVSDTSIRCNALADLLYIAFVLFAEDRDAID